MMRIALIAICLCAVCGVVYGIEKISKQDLKVTKPIGTVTAVYANRDIAEGSILAKDDIVEKEIERTSAPHDFVPAIGLAAGRYAGVAIKEGEIVLMHNLIVRPSGYIRIENSPAPPMNRF